MMARSYPFRCFVEYPPAQQPRTVSEAFRACNIPPVVYPPPPMMQAYAVYHRPPPPPPKKIPKMKKSEKRTTVTTAAVKRKLTPPRSSLAAIQSSIYKNGTLDPDLVKGLCRRSNGKWQAQLYWGGKNRYIGTFDSQEDGALACAVAKEELGHDGNRIDPKTTVGQLIEAREKAFEAVTAVHASPASKKARRTTVESKKPVAKKTRASPRKKSPPPKPETKQVPRATGKVGQDKKSRKARKSLKNKKVVDDEPPKKKSKRGTSKKKGVSSNDSTLDADVSRGITIRPSNRWQAQIYFQGKSRYIGVFETKENAAHAFVVTRGLLKSETQERMHPQKASDTFIRARNTALLAVRKQKFKNGDDYNW